MGIVLRLYDIDIKNDYYLYYKESLTLDDENKGFVKYGELFNKDNNLIILSGITINFNSNYWIKIVDSITNEYVIKEIILHEKEILKENKTVTFFDKIYIFFKNIWEKIYNNIFTKKKIMGVVLRLHDISINNDYYVYYKESLTLGDENKGFVKYGNLFKKDNNIIILSGITFNFNSNYWIKIVDSVTNDYVIKNVLIHESKTFNEYDKINFHVEVNNGIITLYDDNLTENTYSIINGVTNSFFVYSGLTSESFISGSTRLLGIAKRNYNNKILYQFQQENNDDFYVFLVHSDGYNIYSKKQGGFSVRKVNVNNIIREITPTPTPTIPLFNCNFSVNIETVLTTPNNTVTPSPTPTTGLSPTPTPTKTVTPTPTKTIGYVDPLDFNSTYILSYLESFPFSTDNGLAGFNNAIDRTKNTYLQMALAGVDQILIEINWDEVFSTYNQQQSNNSSSWQKYDELINYAKSLTSTKNKAMKVALRITVNKDDGSHYDLENPNNNNGWYGLSNSAKDQFGYPIRVGYGLGHVSLSYPSGVAQVYDFVTKTLLRYKNILGTQFSWYSVVTSSQSENGSNYENQHYVTGSDTPIPLYPALFDYSTYSINLFRNAMQTKYGTIANLNNAWGTNETNFNNIQPPGLGVSGSHEELNNIYKTNKGKDWYYFNENTMFKFLKECEKIGIDNNVTAKFTTESGSDTDILSTRRQSIDISRWVNIGQMHKTQLGGFTGNNLFSHSIDILRTNYARKNRKLGVEINTNDFVTQFPYITDANQIGNAMYEMAQYCILDAEAKEIVIISSRTSPYYDKAKNVVSQVKDLMVNPTSRVPSILPTFEYNVNQIINNGIDWLRNSMISAGHSLTNRISAVQLTNPNYPSNEIENVLILGNSIVHHAPLAEVGWAGDWGMAASSSNKDFVNLLRTYYSNLNSNNTVTGYNIAGVFEQNYLTLDVENDSYLNNIKNANNWTTIIIRLGENISTDNYNSKILKQKLSNLITKMANGRVVKVIISNCFWTNSIKDATFREFAQSNNYKFADLSGLYSYRGVNTSWNIINDAVLSSATNSVKDHPGDAGMAQIANRIINSTIIEVSPSPTTNNEEQIYKSLFTFNQKSNGQPVPTSGDYTNGYLKFYAFSHGISRNITMPQDIGVICKFEYEILNSDNEVVFSCKDNYGGFHPNFQNIPSAESYYRVWTQGHPDYANFQWIRDFYYNYSSITPNNTGVIPTTPNTPFYEANDRGNNHFDIYNGYVPLNKSYIMRIKNTGTFSFQLRAGSIDTFENSSLADVYTTILPDNTWYDFPLNRMRVDNNNNGETRAYKINCYNK